MEGGTCEAHTTLNRPHGFCQQRTDAASESVTLNARQPDRATAHEPMRAPAMSAGLCALAQQRVGAGKANALRADAPHASTHATQAPRRKISELVRHPEPCTQLKRAKTKRLDQSRAGAASTTSVRKTHQGDCALFGEMYESLPTALNWERTDTCTGGLLDWAMDEMQAAQDQDDRRAVAKRVRAPRGKLTAEHAVAIFRAPR